MKPVLFATGHVPAYRVGGFERLHELEGIELALFGGRSLHAGPDRTEPLAVPHRSLRPGELFSLAGSGRYRAVVSPTGGRLAPLAAWAGARRARVPLLLWASLWAHPRSAAHALTYLPLRRLYHSADAVVTYGPHVSAYVRARGARNVHVAPQAVDNAFWGSPEPGAPVAPSWPPQERVRYLFVGRPDREKGVEVLLEAWRHSGLAAGGAALVLLGAGTAARAGDEGVLRLDAVEPQELRRMYAAAEVLVVPSIPTATFREPWGLVVNEAMNRGLAVIASDAVGAAAGGLVRDGSNGLIVPAGDAGALARAMSGLACDGAMRAQMGARGREDVAAYGQDAWAEGFSRALGTVGVSRVRW
ncbi:MAG TPA: glycosyltransferase family 4 protein [Solirubrobacteraceae bacterium]